MLIKECEIAKKYGWLFHGLKYKTGGSIISIDELIKSNTLTESELNEKLFNFFHEKDFFNEIKTDIDSRLQDNDKIKFSKSLKYFNDEEYYIATGLLFELIDSFMIKHNLQILKNVGNDKTKLFNQNIGSQGWNAYNCAVANDAIKYLTITGITDKMFNEPSNITSTFTDKTKNK